VLTGNGQPGVSFRVELGGGQAVRHLPLSQEGGGGQRSRVVRHYAGSGKWILVISPVFLGRGVFYISWGACGVGERSSGGGTLMRLRGVVRVLTKHFWGYSEIGSPPIKLQGTGP